MVPHSWHRPVLHAGSPTSHAACPPGSLTALVERTMSKSSNASRASFRCSSVSSLRTGGRYRPGGATVGWRDVLMLAGGPPPPEGHGAAAGFWRQPTRP
jgi:hypothetical protein